MAERKSENNVTRRIDHSKLKEKLKITLSNLRSDVEIIQEINEVVIPLVTTHSKSKFLELKQEINRLDPIEKVQFDGFWDWMHNPDDNGFSITNTRVNSLVLGLLKDFRLFRRAPMFIRDMGLVYIIASFEDYLSHTLEIVLQYRPEVLIMSEKKFDYKDILRFETKEEILSAIINEEVSALLYKDIEDIKYYLGRFGLDLSKENDWKEFKEVFYRRNIVIHNKSFPSPIYRKKTGFSGSVEKLMVDKEYLDKALVLIQKYANTITVHLTKKFSKEMAAKEDALD